MFMLIILSYQKKTAFFKFNSSDYLDHIKVLLAEADTEALI